MTPLQCRIKLAILVQHQSHAILIVIRKPKEQLNL